MNKKSLSIAIVIIIVCSLFLPPMNKGVKRVLIGGTGRFLSGFHAEGKKVSKFFGFFHNISKLKKENEDLYAKIVSLEVDRSKIDELKHENELLKKEIGYAEKNQEDSLLPSHVIGREPTNFLDHIIVDKGESDGVATGMAVVSGGVLVGQVSKTYNNQSIVTLITSKDSLILAMLEKSRAKGILRGGISGLVLENIVQDTNYKVGEHVVTSGLDGQLKPGLLIGKTSNIQSSSSDLYKNIGVEPIADLSKLELVFITRKAENPDF